jgi:DNA modification methylase
MEYKEFLQTKQKNHILSGFEVDDSQLNSSLFPFQKFIVKRALKAGKYAIFADCGLGKTLMQLEWANQVVFNTGKPVLILAPLAVAGQTINEGVKFGIEVSKYGTKNKSGIFISNYEQIENIDCSIFSGVVLDESSILKNYSGAYKILILQYFQNTPYKLACTATPSPNDELEIGNHSEFLESMTSQDMRAMFFTTDKELIKGNKYRLKKYAEKDFYQWVSTWAVMISKPSDLGFNDDGFNLPPLNYIEKKVVTEIRENGMLFNSVSVSATNFNTELRITKIERLSEVADIVNNSSDNFIVWIKQNEEGEYLKKLIPDAIEVKGSDAIDYKESKLLGFASNEFRVLITKSKIAQFGLNYQNCNNQVFASLDFSFEGLYQSIRRSHRFGQKKTVNIYIITTDTMQNVINSINDKEAKFLKMQDEMRNAILSNIKAEIKTTESETISTENYTLILGDCVEEVAKLPDESIDYSFFSPPFGALYVFSNDPKDMSNVKNNDEFLVHFRFLISDLLRVIKSGRLVSVHMMQSTTLLGRDGYYSIKDFRGDIIRLFESCGFHFHAENMIRKDPKTAAIRTKNRQLMWGTTKSDSAIVRPGLADYILTFKKPGENKVAIQNNIPFDLWCKIAEPVWIDVEEGDTLDYRAARSSDDERHITPTQLKPIEWCYNMWCNKGETVLSPFSGIASEGAVALSTGRKYIGIELKKSYFDLSKKNLESVLESKKQLTLI